MAQKGISRLHQEAINKTEKRYQNDDGELVVNETAYGRYIDSLLERLDESESRRAESEAKVEELTETVKRLAFTFRVKNVEIQEAI
jgi:hypothetical protein